MVSYYFHFALLKKMNLYQLMIFSYGRDSKLRETLLSLSISGQIQHQLMFDKQERCLIY